MLRYISIIAAVLFFTSCQPKEIQVIEEVYRSGAPQMMMGYHISFGDTSPIHRIDYHENGAKRMEGFFKDGQRDGEWLSWYKDGQLWSKGFFENGLRTGKSWVYHPNGKMYMKGAYEHGKKTGLWLVFDEDGNVVGKETF